MAGKRRGRPPDPDQLTPAEWSVADMVRHGMGNGEIARRRGTSRDAVKFHLGNVTGKLGLDGRASLRAWPGIPADSLRHERRPVSMPTSLALGALGQISMPISDVKRSTAFYRDVLGLVQLYTFGDLTFFACAGTRLFLTAAREAPRPPSATSLYFSVPEIGSAHEELSSRGVEFEGAPHLIHTHEDGTEEWMAFFREPDRNLLAIMSRVRPGV
jgi:DNA-binding CsgD family transcriptional regulator/catechol 2,3-dioxygenase-like lactoylglutathione lyase family enzyme